MDKRTLFLAILFFSIFVISCSSQKETENKIVENDSTSQIVRGLIMVVGNEPFTKLAVLINDSTSYIINAPKEIENELKKNQGENYSITYNGKTKVVEGEAIDVIEIKKINK